MILEIKTNINIHTKISIEAYFSKVINNLIIY